MSDVAIAVRNVSHRYGDRVALRDVSLEVPSGEIVSLLGPNGSGKTTLFRLLTTLAPLQDGDARIFDEDLRRDVMRIRRSIGVVFQAPALDRQLTARENLACQGRLYGMRGAALRERIAALLARLGVADRADDRVAELSGGLRRRVELARGLLHRPRLLLLDEPSTGLDPAARNEFWRYLVELRDEEGVTVALTTHLLNEADRSDRVAILDAGRRVAFDTPGELRAMVGGDAITIQTDTPDSLAGSIADRFQCEVRPVDGALRVERSDGHGWACEVAAAFPEAITSITVGKPTLEDVFIHQTGRPFFQTSAGDG